jgi:hypothetical protein
MRCKRRKSRREQDLRHVEKESVGVALALALA